jgi:hypothetical protein
MSGIRQFCDEAKQELFSPLLQSFNEIIRAREAGDEKKMWEATTALRMLAGSTFMAEYLDVEVQQDASELVTFFLQYVKEEIVTARAEYEIPDTCVDRVFKMTLEVTKHCPAK